MLLTQQQSISFPNFHLSVSFTQTIQPRLPDPEANTLLFLKCIPSKKNDTTLAINNH